MGKAINGQALAETIKDQIAEEVYSLGGDQRPNLAIIMIGDRPDSLLYVEMKEKEAKKVGIDTHLYRCDKNINEAEVFEMIRCLNEDDTIDAILVQLPLPGEFDTDGIIMAIDPKKDVDRFHPDNLKILLQSCRHQDVIPPTIEAVLALLESAGVSLEDKLTVIAANSRIFGRSLAQVLHCRGAQAEVVSPQDADFKDRTRQADILISAVGEPGLIKADMIKPEATLIDVGITHAGKKVKGDIDIEECQDICRHYTPVPGGVGPMTIAMLFKNTLELYKKRNSPANSPRIKKPLTP